MTALIGGSLLLIVAAAVALVFGWIGADESLIWTSIGASIAAAVMLSLGYYRSKAEAARRPAAPRPEPGPRKAAARPARSEPQETQPVPAVGASGSEDDTEQVVAYADRSRFHRAGCRYASVPGGERISRDTAIRRGYDPCGVCKP